MSTEWADRLNSVVLPALIEGTTIYTGLGELHPGQGIPNGTGASSDAQDAINKKPIGIPNWQVYLGAKANQPAIRFHELSPPYAAHVGSVKEGVSRFTEAAEGCSPLIRLTAPRPFGTRRALSAEPAEVMSAIPRFLMTLAALRSALSA